MWRNKRLCYCYNFTKFSRIVIILQNNTDGTTAKAANSTTSPTAPTLNLNMTAAELRRQLAERKKLDSRRSGATGDGSLDFRKKYEIVDKL